MPLLSRREVIQLGVGACSAHLLPNFTRVASGQAANGPGLPPDVPLAAPGLKAIRDRAAVLYRQLSLGLDYFGVQQNYVPVLSIAQYESDNDRLAKSGKSMEVALSNFKGAEADLEKQRSVANGVATEAQTQLNTIQSNLVDLPKQQDQLLSAIDDLENEHLKARQDAIDALNRLNASLGQGCGLGSIFAVAGAIISFVGTAGSTSGVILSALASAASGLPAGDKGTPISTTPTEGLVGNAKIFVKDMKVVKGGYDGIKDAYNSAKTVWDSVPQNSEYDGTKYLVEDGDFDDIRKKVEADVANKPDSPEKQAYLDAMNRYLSITQSRNQQIAAFDSLATKLAGQGDEREKWTETLAKANSTLASADVSGAQQLIDMTEASLDLLRRQMQFQIYQTWRAMDYWAMSQARPPKMSDDFASLDGVLGLVTARKSKILQDFGTPPGNLDQTIAFPLSEDARGELLRTGTFTILITPKDPYFVEKTAVLVNSVSARFLNSRRRPILPISYDITHSGYHAFILTGFRVVDFVSQPRKIRYEVKSNGQFQLSQSFAEDGNAQFTEAGGNYVGVSPITKWTVQVDTSLLPTISSVQTVEMRFVGTARA